MKFPERICPNCKRKYDWWTLEFCQKACWEAYEQRFGIVVEDSQ